MLNERVRTVVAATDFSETSLDAASWAQAHVFPGAEFTLVHAIDLAERPAFALDVLPPPQSLEAHAREDAEHRMRVALGRFAGMPPHHDIRIGRPYTELLDAAQSLGAQLIVIGPHGGEPRPSRFLGTTADRIVRTSPVPVLVGTNPPAGPPKRLLVPVDDVDEVERQLAWTRDLAEAFEAEVVLLHVWSNAVYSHVASMSYATKHDEDRARADIENELQMAATEWMNRLARTGMQTSRVSVKVGHGKAGNETLSLATRIGADLIVLARRTSGLVAPAMLGSTIGTVLHGARCPVLTV